MKNQRAYSGILAAALFAVAITFVICNPCRAESTKAQQEALFRGAMNQMCRSIIGCSIGLNPVAYLSSSERIAGLKGLDTSEAVPFLLDIVQNGFAPDPNSAVGDAADYRYVSRCYAMLCLAATRDERAYPVLAQILQNRESQTGRAGHRAYDIYPYAATGLLMLRDERAIPLFVANMRDPNSSARDICIVALAIVGDKREARELMQVLTTDTSLEGYFVHNCMARLTGVKLEYGFQPKTRAMGFKDFPELGEVKMSGNNFRAVWRHWVEVGPKWTKDKFDSSYGDWKAAKAELAAEKSEPNSGAYKYKKGRVGHWLGEMAVAGVAVLPLMMEKIKSGDTELIPVVSRLTDGEVSQAASSKETLAWWQANKEKWLIFPEEGNGQK